MNSDKDNSLQPAAGIVVIGSSNTDMVIMSSRIPLPGETIIGGEFLMNPGGKGANQAVAAARLGAAVTFIARVGEDIFGTQAIQHFNKEGIDTAAVLVDKNHPSGVALITVDAAGENCIVVASGANGFLSATDIRNSKEKLINAGIIVMQLEIPVETVYEVVLLAKQYNKKIILNPAPAQVLPDEIFEGLFLLTPNEVEAEMLSGIKIISVADCEKAANFFAGKGVLNCIITLGDKGVFVYSESFKELIPVVKAVVVDTTAAGDVFTAAVAVALAEGKSIREAAVFGCKAAAISVTRKGAQASAPYRSEIEISHPPE